MINILITCYALFNGIDPQLAFQVAKTESSMNPNAISCTGDGGLFQLNNRSYKFHNEKWRFIPVVNIAVALNSLRILKKTCKHRLNNSYVLCYNMGERGASKIKFPYKQTYYQKMNILWRD